jgi:hypothetical protein
MILNSTYHNDDTIELINDIVGQPFSWLKRFKLGGVGSKRMIINTCSPKFSFIKNKTEDINYGNIELRPRGIVVYINKGLETFAWPIPYYKLVVYKTEGLSLHANGSFIKFKSNKTFKENKSFISKLLDQKILFQTNIFAVT